MVPPASGRIPPVPPYSGSPLGAAARVSHTGLSPSTARLSRRLPLPCRRPSPGALQPRARLDAPGLGSAAFAHHYSRYHCCFLLLRLLRCFSSAGSPPHSGMAGLLPAGLPHSDIRGSKPIGGSPRLFAACRVLLRLREPRHPPCALSGFSA